MPAANTAPAADKTPAPADAAPVPATAPAADDTPPTPKDASKGTGVFKVNGAWVNAHGEKLDADGNVAK